MRHWTIVLLVILSSGLAPFRASAGPQVKVLESGAAAPDFNLPGVDGASHRLHDYDKAKILVVLFTSNHCPTAQAYEARIKKFYADYKEKGVALVAINPNNPAEIGRASCRERV